MNKNETLDNYLNSLSNKYDSLKYKLLQKSVLSYLNNCKVLDLGCGGGFFSVWMAKNGAEVWGVDLNSDKIEAAKLYAQNEKLEAKTHFLCDDVCKVKVSQKFDLIIAKDIIEHVDDELLLKNIRKHSSQDSHLLISTHNSLSLQYVIMSIYYFLFKKGQYLGTDPTHVRMYSPTSLTRVISKHFIKPIKWISCYHIPYRLIKNIIPIKILEFLPFHIIEYLFSSTFPFNKLGWSITTICKIKKAKNASKQSN